MGDNGSGQFPEGDKGLDYIIPLLIFMHQTLLKAVCKYFVKHFEESSYVKENGKTPEQRSKTLTSFFEEMNEKANQEKKSSQRNLSQQNQNQQQQSQSCPNQQCQNQQQQNQAQRNRQHQSQPRQNPQWQNQSHQSQAQPDPPQQNPPSLMSLPIYQGDRSRFRFRFPQHGGSQSDSRSRGCHKQGDWGHTHHHYRHNQQPSLLPNHPNCRRGSSDSRRWGHTHHQDYNNQQVSQLQSRGQDNSAKHSKHHHGSSRSRGVDLRGTHQGRRNKYPSHSQSGQDHSANRPDQSRRQDNQQQPSQSPHSSQSQQNQASQSQQQGSQGQNSASNLEERCPKILSNIRENSNILNVVTVGDLIQGNNVCQELLKLDINFLLNAVLNKTLGLPLDGTHRKALFDIKDTRKDVVHARYDFGEEAFNKNLSAFENAARKLYEHLNLGMEKLQHQVTVCKENVDKGCKVLCILDELAKEAHRKYCFEDTFVLPHLTQASDKQVIQDLTQFIRDQTDSRNLILVSGEHKKEKTQLLSHLASTLKRCNKYKLVLFLDEGNRRLSRWISACSSGTDDDNIPTTLPEQVLSCLTHLAPYTVDMYGLDSAMKAVERCWKEVLVLINWNIFGDIMESELVDGTWVFTYDGKEPDTTMTWKVLEVEPYTPEQVHTMIGRGERWDQFQRFRHSSVLSSLDMISTFSEVCSSVSMCTDFDLVERYVQNTFVRNEDIVRLGQNTLFGPINDISDHLRESLLYPVREEWRFKHSIVRDFVIAKYFVSEPLEACPKLLENVAAHKRVFKFACFLWCRQESSNSNQSGTRRRSHCCLSSSRRKDHVKAFLKKFLCASEDGNRREGNRNLFDSWDYLLELDDVCDRFVECFMSIVSDIPYWCFDVDHCQGLEMMMTRLGKALKKVRLSKNKPLTIVIKATTSTKLLTALWKVLRAAEGLYCHEGIKVSFEVDIGLQIPTDEVESFLKEVADTEVPLYIRSYSGPFLSSMSKCFRSYCMKNLKLLRVCVCDVPSLQKVLECTAQEMDIEVNIEGTHGHHLRPASIKIPADVALHIVMKYSPNSQQLLDAFMGSQNVLSLELLISPDYPLARHLLTQGSEMMDVVMDGARSYGHSKPLSRWLSNLPLPSSGLRLLLRDVNIAFRNNLFNYRVRELLVLDARNSLSRAMNGLDLQASNEEEPQGSALKRKDCRWGCQSPTKKTRMSIDEPAATSSSEGVEVVIATDMGFCFDCWFFCCRCVFRVGRERRNRTHISLNNLIEHMMKLGIQYSYYHE